MTNAASWYKKITNASGCVTYNIYLGVRIQTKNCWIPATCPASSWFPSFPWKIETFLWFDFWIRFSDAISWKKQNIFTHIHTWNKIKRNLEVSETKNKLNTTHSWVIQSFLHPQYSHGKVHVKSIVKHKHVFFQAIHICSPVSLESNHNHVGAKFAHSSNRHQSFWANFKIMVLHNIVKTTHLCLGVIEMMKELQIVKSMFFIYGMDEFCILSNAITNLMIFQP